MYALITIYWDEIKKDRDEYTYEELQKEYSDKDSFETLEQILFRTMGYLNTISYSQGQDYFFVVNEETEEIIC